MNRGTNLEEFEEFSQELGKYLRIARRQYGTSAVPFELAALTKYR